MMRMSPNNLLANYPCSIVTICSAYSEIMRVDMEEALEKCLEVCERVEPAFKNIGYLSLKEFNKVVRGMLPVKRTSYYKRGERVSLKKLHFSGQALVCVLGHYLYLDGERYWSFFDNEGDMVVKVWEIG